MTVTNGTNSETVTMPSTMHQEYETVTTPLKGDHGQPTVKNPKANGVVNGEDSVNGNLNLPAIPTIDYKTEAAIPPAVCIQHNGESTVPPVQSHEQKADPTSFLVLNETTAQPAVSIKHEGKPLASPVSSHEQKGGLTSSPAQSNGHVDEALLPPCTRLQRFLKESDDILVCPGVYDGFSARIALSVGFKAMYMVCWLLSRHASSTDLLISTQTGAGTTASRLGMADLGVAQLHDMREHAEMIANLDPQRTPLIADMDTGYGGTSSTF